MKHQKPLAVKIFIRVCIVIVGISLIWVSSLIGTGGWTVEEGESTEVDTWVVEDLTWDINVLTWDLEDLTWAVDELSWDLSELTWDNVLTAGENVIVPEIDAENPENTQAPILVTEDGEINEMDQTFELQLDNGETEIVRQWDLWDSIQIAQ